jgi:transcriptional regulator with XRE-family HTH domain
MAQLNETTNYLLIGESAQPDAMNSYWLIPPEEYASPLQQRLKTEFQDPDTRYAYAESSLNTRLASQIKILREQRGLTQAQLAELCGTKQAGLSRFEDVNHSVWKTDTLWKIARALGVRVHISFETFGTLLHDKQHFSRESLERPQFEDDPAFTEGTQAYDPKKGTAEIYMCLKPVRAAGPFTNRTIVPIDKHALFQQSTSTNNIRMPVSRENTRLPLFKETLNG